MDKTALRTIPVAEAVGTVLFHDLTRIEPGVSKGPAFRKGHIVREEDIPILLKMGKENLYVCELLPGMLHENDAARRSPAGGRRDVRIDENLAAVGLVRRLRVRPNHNAYCPV